MLIHFSLLPSWYRQATALILLILLGLNSLARVYAQCPVGDVTLSTQADVNKFPSNCVNFTNNLTISGSDITDLRPLATLRTIEKTLTIQNNTNLSSLVGLGSLQSIGGLLEIYNNPTLTSLTSLSALTRIGNDLRITSNGSLSSLAGLSALTQTGFDVRITDNGALSSLTGLSSLTSTGTSLFIQNNPNLSSIASLSALTQIGSDLRITNNGSLTGLTGLGRLQTVNGSLLIQNNAQLSSIASLTGLTQVGFALQVSDNGSLTKLTGLDRITSTGGNLLIQNNAQLSSIASLSALTQVGSDLQISGNGSLTKLTGLGALTRIGNNLLISGNESLTGLTGLDRLQSVGRDVVIQNNPRLTSIASLSALTRIGNNLQITNNALLSSLSGLGSLTRVGFNLEITNNPRLSSLASLNALTYVNYTLRISGNESLSSLSGLTSLQGVGRNLEIQANPRLSSLASLTALTQVGFDLQISGNSSLTGLTGLSSLTSVYGQLIIQNNVQLTSLAALSSLQSAFTYLLIQNNPTLSACAIAAVCAKLATQPESTSISGNAPGCASKQEVQADCTPLAITTQPPRSATVCSGATVTAALSTTGNVRTYQWYRNGQSIPGQTSATLSLTNVQPAQAGDYLAVVSNSVSSLTSTTFSLTVNPTPVLSLTNNGPLTCARPVVALNATASPAGGTYFFFGPGASENTNSSQIFVVTPGLYNLIYTSPQGCQATITTTVERDISAPALRITSDGPLTCQKPAVTLSVSADQGGSLPQGTTYQWQGPGSFTTAASSFTTGQPGSYSLVARFPNGCSSVASTTITSSAADLVPLLYVTPTSLTSNSPLSVVVDVVNIGDVASTGTITLKISRDAKLTLSLPPDATQVGIRSVQNSEWQLGQEGGYYVLTTSSSAGAGDKLSVGLTGLLQAGGSKGQLSVSVVVVGGCELRLINNVDAEKIDYF